jgi:putative membrane protein
MPVHRPSWFRRIWPSLPVWRRLDLIVLVICAYTAIVTAFYESIQYQPPQWSGITAAITALVLSPLLTFRNLGAYDRWWEGRRLWGQLINDSRNFAIKLRTFDAVPAAECRAVVTHVVEFAFALKRRLRGDGGDRHLPLDLAGRVMAALAAWRAKGLVSDLQLLWIDPHARALMDVCGACERIRYSPVPLSYRALLRHGLVIYIVTTPWLVADQLDYWSVPALGVLSYFLFGVELTAEDVENPFGTDGDDLELASFCETIRVSVGEVIGPAPSDA